MEVEKFLYSIMSGIVGGLIVAFFIRLFQFLKGTPRLFRFGIPILAFLILILIIIIILERYKIV